MNEKTAINHRCKKSIANEMSIRFCEPYIHRDCENWWLMKHEHDWDWDSHYLNPIVVIDYCPFCGEKLKEREENER